MYRRILVPITDSRAATAALDEAAALARLVGATLRIVHLVDEMRIAPGPSCYGAYSGELTQLLKEAGEQLLQRAAERALAAGVMPQTRLIEAFAMSVSDAVLDQCEAWHPGLIVMGARSRSSFLDRLLGSETDRVVRLSKVPVMLVRAAGGQADRGHARRVAPAAGHSLSLQAE